MNKYVKRYLIDAMSGMAQGLFASLLIGTIIKTLGQQLLRLSVNPVFQFLVDAGNFAAFQAEFPVQAERERDKCASRLRRWQFYGDITEE